MTKNVKNEKLFKSALFSECVRYLINKNQQRYEYIMIYIVATVHGACCES